MQLSISMLSCNLQQMLPHTRKHWQKSEHWHEIGKVYFIEMGMFTVNISAILENH